MLLCNHTAVLICQASLPLMHPSRHHLKQVTYTVVHQHWQHSFDADVVGNALSELALLVQHAVLDSTEGAALQDCSECPERQYSVFIMTHNEHHEQLTCTGLHAWQLLN